MEEQGHTDLLTFCLEGVTEALTDRLDATSPTSDGDGATPVSLAVGDVDLFGDVARWLPWEHKPAEVVAELLTLPADLQLQEHSSCSELHRAARIRSPLQEQVVHTTAEAPSQAGSASESHRAFNKNQDFDSEFEESDTESVTSGLYPHHRTAASPVQTPTNQWRFLMHGHTEEVLELPGCLTLSDHCRSSLSQDKGNPLCFQNAMETLSDIRQAHRDAERGSRQRNFMASLLVLSSRGSSLPSLGDSRSRGWGRDPAPSCGSSPSPRSSRRPVPPRHRRRTESEVAASQSLPGLLSVTESSQLSQSAPSVMEPLLSSDIMLQARAHIQTRLGCSSAGNDQMGLLSALHPRTPKLLAPLDRRPALPVLKQNVPLKPISQSPSSSMTQLRRERLSWGSPRTGPHSTKGGSEESGSSSSSHSSMDLEDEDEEDESDIPERYSEVSEPNLSGRRLQRRWKDRSFTETDLVGDTKLSGVVRSKIGPIPQLRRSASDLLCTEKVLDGEHDATQATEDHPDHDAKQDDTMNDIRHSVNINIQVTLGAEEENHVSSSLKPDVEIIPNSTDIIDKLHRVKTAEGDAKLARVAPKTGDSVAKSSKPGQNKERRSGDMCDLRAKNPTDLSSNLPAHKSKSNLRFSAQAKDKVRVKGAHCGTGTAAPGKKVVHHPQKIRANPEKRVAQQHVPTRELNSATHSKNLAAAGTPRSRSAADFIAYKDMFQRLQSGGEGPAIYEMFAGPVYENLRVPSTCGKTRHVQPTLCRKTQQSHKVKRRPLKQPQRKLRRSPKETTVIPPKNKATFMSPMATNCRRNGSNKMENLPGLETESGPSKNIELCCDNSPDKPEDHVLSTKEEALSIILKSQTVETLAANRTVHESLWHQNQLKINTWTSSSSSSSTVTSPIYQTFLDEVGDGPLTDDLLQCLAEELISLDERDVSTSPCTQNSNGEGSGRDEAPEVASADSVISLGSGLDVGDTITWTKGEVLGRGAYGTVYCGLTSQGQLVAVKQVCLDTSDPSAAQREYNRLQEEVELLKALRHANIVGFLGTSLHQHVVSIFMEYVPGGSIASILHRFGPLPERVLALYTRQIVEGVAYLHLNRVIHRDLKGNNVMLMPTGVIKLIDFGCARRLSCLSHSGGGSSSSSSGDLLKSVHGTPYWMAPEVISDTGYGRKSDIWSVGCTVFEMATGKPPLANMDKMAAMFYIGAKRGLMPSLPDGFSGNAKDFVKICLTSNQRLRPSADQLMKHSFISKSEPAVTTEAQKKTCCSHSGLCC